MICGQLPSNSKLSFDSIVMYTKFPISIKDIKKGLAVRVPLGVVTPQKNTSFDGDVLENDTLVRQVHQNAKMITQMTGKTKKIQEQMGKRSRKYFGLRW